MYTGCDGSSEAYREVYQGYREAYREVYLRRKERTLRRGVLP